VGAVVYTREGRRGGGRRGGEVGGMEGAGGENTGGRVETPRVIFLGRVLRWVG